MAPRPAAVLAAAHGHDHDHGHTRHHHADRVHDEHDGHSHGPVPSELAGPGIEFAAAGLVLLFGAGLLFGYLAAERVSCL